MGLLLDAGANTNTQVGFYSNALMAALFSHKAIVDSLINNGAFHRNRHADHEGEHCRFWGFWELRSHNLVSTCLAHPLTYASFMSPFTHNHTATFG